MSKTIDISKINRKKLGAQLHHGAHLAIQRRLEKRGIALGYRTIRYAFEPDHTLTKNMREIIKETLAYLEDLRKDEEVQVHKDIADALSDEPETSAA